MLMKKGIYKILSSRIRPIELASLIKGLLFIKRRVFKMSNFSMYIDPVSNLGYTLISKGEYEPVMAKILASHLKGGDLFIDLGANEGYFSILAAKLVGEKGRVFSIEPQLRLHPIIMRNVNINNVYNINLLPFAISDEIREVELTLSPTINSGSSTAVNEVRRSLWKKQKVNATTLDKIFDQSNQKPIALMKVDIEGFELLALTGAREILNKGLIRKIVVEKHPVQLKQLGQTVDMIDEFLNGLGYFEENGVYSKHDKTVEYQ